VNPSLDMNNRSVIANILVESKDNWPLPGENVRLEIESSSPVDVITVPMDAITYDNNDAVVFVKLSEDKYEKRILEVTNGQGDYAIVRSGLKESEEVAISQVFSLKALARYEQFAD
jgi:cobalt-zinc-cadmium efflux system membrane fusion protein